MADDQRSIYEALLKAQSEGIPVALAIVTSTEGSIPRHAGSKMLVYSDGTTTGTVGGGALEQRVIEEALAALGDGQPRSTTYALNDLESGDPGVCGGSATLFIEPVGVVPRLVVVGAGHVGKALAELARWVGFRVTICDDREEFCNPEYLPGMDDYVVCKPGELTEHISIDRLTYIAALTRGVPIDVELIPTLLETRAAYIGLIGSRRRWALTVKTLKDEHGLTETDLVRVHAPIGLELEAETPREIAISILAEIIMIWRGGTGEPMQWIGGVDEAEAAESREV